MVLQPCSLNGIEFDALISESRNYRSEVPDYAVETGFDVTDNIAVKPLTVELAVYATPTPVTWHGRHGNRSVEELVSDLEALFFSRPLVTLRTGTDVYGNMAIESMTVPKDETNKRSREIRITLRQVNTVASQATAIPASYARGGATGARAGTAPTAPGSGTGGTQGTGESGKKASILYNLFNN